jgi:chromosomal replication initiation ATPase DnaA
VHDRGLWRTLTRRAKPFLLVQDVLKVVASFYGITVCKILADRRTVDVVVPRQVAMYLAAEFTEKSMPEIGRRMGGRDHTTIIYSVRKIKETLDDRPGASRGGQTFSRPRSRTATRRRSG